jgi:hypothetical protein
MRSHKILIAILSLAMGGAASAEVQPVPAATELGAEPSAETWIAKKSDNICGISDPKKVSNPAKVKYDKCLAETWPMKKIEEEDIDPESPEGKALRAKAVRLVTKAAQQVMGDNAYCSVWKAIKHADGRDVPDVTDEVKRALD